MRETECVIDRFEGELAVLEQDGRTFEVPRTWLPRDAAEGDVVQLSARGSRPDTTYLRFKLDPQATAARREGATKLRDKLTKGPEGDLEL